MGRLRGLVLHIAHKLAILTALGLVTSPAAAWADCPALGLMTVPVAVNNVGTPITDYFALVTVDTATPIGAGTMRPDGGDIRFGDEACTSFSYWIESGLNTSATHIWVKVPAVPTGTSAFYLFFGNPALTRTDQASDIFGPGIASLYTFTEPAGTTTISDWVGGHHLTLSGDLAWTAGPRPGISSLTGFSPASGAVASDIGVSLGTGDFTVFSVVNPTGIPSVAQGIMGSYAGSKGWALAVDSELLALGTVDPSIVSLCTAHGPAIPANEWSMVGGRRVTAAADSVLSVLGNGMTLVSEGCGAVQNVSGTVPFELGGVGLDSAAFNGAVSLSLVYTEALSDAAIAALYQSLFPETHPTLVVGEAPQAIAITSADQATFTVTAPGAFTFTATGSPAPTFSLTGALPTGIALDGSSGVLSGTPTLGTAGVYTLVLTASNGGITQGDTQNFTLIVNRTAQTISFANPGPQTAGGPPMPLIGNASSGLPVTFASTTPAVCTVSDMAATLLDGGTCTIVASQAGDAGSYLPAQDVAQSFAVASGAPQSPTDVTVTARGNLVTLSWSAAPTGAAPDAYLVEVGDGPGRTTVTTLLTTQLTESGLLPQGEYYLRVRAQNEEGLSDPSDDVWVRVTASAPAAAPPVGFGASVAGTTVHLSWNNAAIGAPPESYLLQVGTDPFSANVGEFTIPAGTTAITATSVPQGSYVARVRAITSAGPTPPTPALWFRVGAAAPCGSAPESPMMLTPVISDPIVGLSWLPPADGAATSFVVHAGSSTGASDLAVVDLGTVAGLGASVGDGQYWIRAVSVDECGTSAPSVEQTLTIGGTAPSAPTGFSATPGPGSVTFNWTPPSGIPATHYVIEAGLTSGTTLLKFPVTGASTLTVPGIASGATFVARVRSANASGIGAASSEIVVTVP